MWESSCFFEPKPLLNPSRITLHLRTAYQWNKCISFKRIKKAESEPGLSHCTRFIIGDWLTVLDRKTVWGKRHCYSVGWHRRWSGGNTGFSKEIDLGCWISLLVQWEMENYYGFFFSIFYFVISLKLLNYHFHMKT